MASSLSCFCCSNQRIIFHYPRMRSQSFRDNGKPENSVDANLRVLRARIHRIKEREKLVDRCGWNYKHVCEDKHKISSSPNDHKANFLSEFAELMAIICGAIGLVFLFGSLCLCLVSLLFGFISNNDV
ncbi:uncharacterized protein LOC129310552 [Prosopis cineraria]|uniref:uncharacterized protein LOC129310552 n=1 Tax=Prosopis cineraria TaxID=364024 RepID=UPI00241066A0|nr:uncharacterized protein LOC129310552 [Prosopis cineraria]